MRTKLLLLFFALGEITASAQTDSLPNITKTSNGKLIDPIQIHEVVVTGTRNETDIRHLPMTISVIDRKQIEQSMQPSILPILTQQVPGLFITARGIMGYGVSGGAAGGMSLRGIGSGSGRLMVLIDGHPQYMGLMGHPIADAYQSLMAERVEVLRGPASVLYGSNAMGGVINIVTRRLHEEGVKTNINLGYGSFNTLQSEVTNRIRKGGFTSLISGSYNRTDGHRRNMGFEQYGGYAKLGYEFSPYWNIRGDVNVTHFNASQPGEVTDPMIDAAQSITRGMTSVAVENRYERTSGAVSFFYNWGDHWINDGYTANPDDKNNPKPYRFDSHDDMMGISWYQSAQLFTGNRLTAGVDYYRFGGKAQNRYVEGERNGEREHIVDKVQHEIAGYIDFRQDISHWLTLDAGIRIDHHSHIGTEWIPQAGLSFHLPGSIELKASAGKGFRYPTIREMYMFPPKNPDLRPESMLHRIESKCRQRISLSYHTGNVYVPSQKPRSSTRVHVELRTGLRPTSTRRKAVVWYQRFLYRREKSDRRRASCGSDTLEHEHRENRQHRSRSGSCLPYSPPLVGRNQLQLSAHGQSGTRRTRT